MIAVVDANVLRYMVLTDTAELLPRIFDKVYIPEGVRQELLRSTNPKLENEFSLCGVKKRHEYQERSSLGFCIEQP